MKYLPYIVIAVLILFIVFRPARVEHVSGEVVSRYHRKIGRAHV